LFTFNIKGSVLTIILCFSFIACGGGSDDDESNNPLPPTATCATELAGLEESIRNDLNSLATDTDFTLLMTASDGKQFEYNRGVSTGQTSYRSASTSKWISAVIIISLVESGDLSLDDQPQDYISNWPINGNLSNITLRDLLSFTSGLTEAPLCINLGGSDPSACVDTILSANLDNTQIGGEEYYYGPSHMQVASMMAINALGVESWQDVYTRFRNSTDLFPTSRYDLPSISNPRLAGGMHWTGDEYLAFLQSIYEQTILTPEIINEMNSDQIVNSTIVSSPAQDSINEDWHYGLGLWVECHVATFNCDQTTKISSPGAYGAYPFIDYVNNYYGIIAREGEFGTFNQGYAVFTSVSSKLEEWSAKICN